MSAGQSPRFYLPGSLGISITELRAKVDSMAKAGTKVTRIESKGISVIVMKTQQFFQSLLVRTSLENASPVLQSHESFKLGNALEIISVLQVRS